AKLNEPGCAPSAELLFCPPGDVHSNVARANRQSVGPQAGSAGIHAKARDDAAGIPKKCAPAFIWDAARPAAEAWSPAGSREELGRPKSNRAHAHADSTATLRQSAWRVPRHRQLAL